MSLEKRKKWIEELADKHDSLLTPLGFVRAGKWSWLRKLHWKTDEVEISTKIQYAQCFIVGYTVYLPPYKLDGAEYIPFEQADPRALCGGVDKKWIDVPSWGFSRRKLSDQTLNELNKTVCWFDDHFLNPEMCLEYLRKSNPAVEGNFAQSVEEYLQLVIKEKHHPYLEELEKQASKNTRKLFF